jgi:hypothetical protein
MTEARLLDEEQERHRRQNDAALDEAARGLARQVDVDIIDELVATMPPPAAHRLDEPEDNPF